MNLRPSNIIRGIENVVGNTARFIAGGVVIGASSAANYTSEVARDLRVEMRARQLDARMREVHAQAEKLAGLSDSQYDAFHREQREIAQRALELRTKRAAKAAEKQVHAPSVRGA